MCATHDIEYYGCFCPDCFMLNRPPRSEVSEVEIRMTVVAGGVVWVELETGKEVFTEATSTDTFEHRPFIERKTTMYCHTHFKTFYSHENCPVCSDVDDGTPRYYVYAGYNYYVGSQCKTIKLIGMYKQLVEAQVALKNEELHQIESEDQYCWMQQRPYVLTPDDMSEE